MTPLTESARATLQYLAEAQLDPYVVGDEEQAAIRAALALDDAVRTGSNAIAHRATDATPGGAEQAHRLEIALRNLLHRINSEVGAMAAHAFGPLFLSAIAAAENVLASACGAERSTAGASHSEPPAACDEEPTCPHRIGQNADDCGLCADEAAVATEHARPTPVSAREQVLRRALRGLFDAVEHETHRQPGPLRWYTRELFRACYAARAALADQPATDKDAT